MQNVFEQVYENLSQRGDKSGTTDADGFLICDKCGERKQADVNMPLGDGLEKTYRMPIACSCVKETNKIHSQTQAAQYVESIKRSGLSDPKYYDFSFNNDDRRNPEISKACRNYVDKWQEYKANNIGILFYGNVGTGKSFLACCIANALIEKQIPAMVTSFPAILKTLQSFGGDRDRVYSSIKKAALLVIDDLGVERDTPTALEQVYSIIDSRLLSKKPTIFTTNLDIKAIEYPKDMSYKRIYSRVLEMCPIKLFLDGTDRRIESAETRAELARQIMRGVK